MVSLGWCKKQSRGICLIDEKVHLSKSYMEDAYESFNAFLINKGKWKVITGYYACYNALYSLLMRCGIKSEIHDCTICLMGLFGFSEDDIEFLKNLKTMRIDTQYYLKECSIDSDVMIKEFISRCELLLNDLNDNMINEIRGAVKNEK